MCFRRSNRLIERAPAEVAAATRRTRPSATKIRSNGNERLSLQPENRGCVTHREYSEQLLEHYRYPRNVGDLPGADAVVTVGNPNDGDVLKLSVKLDAGRVSEARFKSFGCAVAIASGSVATEMIRGMRLEELAAVSNPQVAAALGGVPEEKWECSLLVEQALRKIMSSCGIGTSEAASMDLIDEPHRGNAAGSAADPSPRG